MFRYQPKKKLLNFPRSEKNQIYRYLWIIRKSHFVMFALNSDREHHVKLFCKLKKKILGITLTKTNFFIFSPQQVSSLQNIVDSNTSSDINWRSALNLVYVLMGKRWMVLDRENQVTRALNWPEGESEVCSTLHRTGFVHYIQLVLNFVIITITRIPKFLCVCWDSRYLNVFWV